MMRWRPVKWWAWFLVPIVWPAWAVALIAMGYCDLLVKLVDRAFPWDDE
jgi:hypothetical protein